MKTGSHLLPIWCRAIDWPYLRTRIPLVSEITVLARPISPNEITAGFKRKFFSESLKPSDFTAAQSGKAPERKKPKAKAAQSSPKQSSKAKSAQAPPKQKSKGTSAKSKTKKPTTTARPNVDASKSKFYECKTIIKTETITKNGVRMVRQTEQRFYRFKFAGMRFSFHSEKKLENN